MDDDCEQQLMSPPVRRWSYSVYNQPRSDPKSNTRHY